MKTLFFTMLLLMQSGVFAMGMSGMVTNQISRTVNEGISKNLFDNMIIPQLKVKNASGQVKQISLSTDQRFLTLLLEDGTARVWDLDVGVQRPMVTPEQEKIQAISANVQQNLLYAAHSGKIKAYNFLTADLVYELDIDAADIVEMAVSADNRFILLRDSRQQLSVWDRAAKTLKWRFQFSEDDAEIKAMKMDDQGRYIALLIRKQAMFSDSERIQLMNARDGVVMAELDDDGNELAYFDFSRADTLNAIYKNGEWLEWSTQSKQVNERRSLGFDVIAANRSENGVLAVALSEEEIRIMNSKGMELSRIEGKPIGGLPIRVLNQGKKMFLVHADGKVSLWNTQTGEQVLQMISTLQGWSVVDESGRFDSSEKAMGNITWEAAETDIPIDSFSNNYYEPGLLATALNDETYINRNPTPVTRGITLPPQLEVVVKDIKKTKDNAELTVEVYGQGGGIKQVNLFHNSKIVPNRRALVNTTTFKKDNRERQTLQMKVAPTRGINRVKVVAMNKMGIEGTSHEVSFQVEKVESKPVLHVATVGVNEYRDSQLNLDYSVADAETISKILKENDLGRFAKINRKQLYNGNATKLSILSVLNELSSGAEGDVLAVYFAGHGIAVNGEWYFLPHETILQPDLNYYTTVGISATEISEIFIDSKIQQIMLMVDACYSGASVDSFKRLQNSQRKFSRSLSKSVGLTVVTATRRDQEAAELSELGHGLFTYVLTKGMKGEADRWPKDSLVSAHEIARFSTKTIPAITQKFLGAAQEPTAFTMGKDFSLLQN